MDHGTTRRRRLPTGSLLLRGALVFAVGIGVGACSNSKPKPAPVSRYQQLPIRQVPPYMKGTILEQVDLANTEPFLISSYGLVSQLDGTGDSTAPQAVRQYMLKEITRRGFGSPLIREYSKIDAQDVLKDPRNAIVAVEAYVPPGARYDDRMDVQVTALPQSTTTSLAGGVLFQTDLRIRGMEDLEGAVTVHARAQGPVFINPAYAIDSAQSETRGSRRRGVILDGGVMREDRPLVLRIRQAQLRMARAIELRVNERFQAIADKPTKRDFKNFISAEAQDEGLVHLYVPRQYGGDWEHFANVVTHLFLNSSPEFAALKAKELADEAVKPDAPLLDISYCWEGLGPAALPFVLPLMSHEKSDVAFAAARAAAFLGDVSAQTALVQMAKSPENPFQINAVQVIGALPTSPAINMKLRELLESDQTLVRIEAYRVLARHRDPIVYTKVINEKFVLDIVPSAKGPALIYASRTGIPRIAVFGARPTLELPITFLAMGSRLSVTSQPGEKTVQLYYRGTGPKQEAISVQSNADAAEIIARLGGEGPDKIARLNFSYADIVGIIQALADQKKLVARTPDGKHAPVAFVLQESPGLIDDIYNAPVIPDNARPQEETNAPNAEVGMRNAK